MKQTSPPKQDRGTVTVVTSIDFQVQLDALGIGALEIPLSAWRGVKMPEVGDRVFRAGGWDVAAGKPRNKWKILPPELDQP